MTSIHYTAVLIPSLAEQRAAGQADDTLIDPYGVVAKEDKYPLFQGGDFSRPMIGYVTNVRIDDDRLVADVVSDQHYELGYGLFARPLELMTVFTTKEQQVGDQG